MATKEMMMTQMIKIMMYHSDAARGDNAFISGDEYEHSEDDGDDDEALTNSAYDYNKMR